jgi:hypothetical protein
VRPYDREVPDALADPSVLADLTAYVDASRPEFERRLAELVAIPGVSADPAHAADITRTAE